MSGKQQTRIIARLCAACAFSALALGWSHARADETTNALLDLLKAKGAITQSEYDKNKARQQAEAKDSAQKLQAAETRAREAEAKAHEAEAKAHQAEAKAQSDSATSEAEIAKVKAQTLTAADMAVPTKAPPGPAVQYVTVLPNCVGIRVGEVDICTKGDISFFGVEDFPDRNPVPPSINGGLAQADPAGKNSNAIRGGLLPSSFQVGLSTHQLGMDIGVYLGIYTGGNNANVGLFNANNGGAPFGLGTAGIDFRQFFGTIGTPWFGTVKIGRDIGLFGSDAILNDLTLFGVGSPGNNFAPGDTTLGRIGVGYIYADFIPQITYKSPTFGGLTGWVSVMTPLAPFAFSGDPTSANACLDGATLSGGTCNGWTNSDAPMVQGKLQYVTPLQWLAPDAKLTLSTSGLWERQQADCSTQATLPVGGTCFTGLGTVTSPFVVVNLNGTPLNPNATVDAWAADAFAMVDVWGWNLVAYGYTGKGVGTTALFFDGIDRIGGARHSEGGYFQAAYTFKGGVFLPQDLTVGASWGVSHLETANNDNLVVLTDCGQFGGPLTATGGQSCLVKDNQSWIGFARYKLTKWVNLQAEYTATTSENQIGQKIRDDAIAVGTTFFW
jgi:predicted porin